MSEELTTTNRDEAVMANLSPNVSVISPEAILLDEQIFNRLNTCASIMASGKCTVPVHLQGNPGDCFAVITQAMRWKMDPYAVAQKTHIVSGKLGYESQLVAAAINSVGPVLGRPQYEWYGPWERVIGKFNWKVSQKTGNKYQVPAWSGQDEEGCGVRVSCQLKTETEPRVLELLLSQATVRNSTLWASDPKQQLAYLALKRWARLHCPDVIMGVYSPDELQQSGPKMATTIEEVPLTDSRSEDLANRLGIEPSAEAAPVEVIEPEPKVEEGSTEGSAKEPDQTQEEPKVKRVTKTTVAEAAKQMNDTGIPDNIINDYLIDANHITVGQTYQDAPLEIRRAMVHDTDACLQKVKNWADNQFAQIPTHTHPWAGA